MSTSGPPAHLCERPQTLEAQEKAVVRMLALCCCANIALPPSPKFGPNPGHIASNPPSQFVVLKGTPPSSGRTRRDLAGFACGTALGSLAATQCHQHSTTSASQCASPRTGVTRPHDNPSTRTKRGKECGSSIGRRTQAGSPACLPHHSEGHAVVAFRWRGPRRTPRRPSRGRGRACRPCSRLQRCHHR